jgi:hypothetical protein
MRKPVLNKKEAKVLDKTAKELKTLTDQLVNSVAFTDKSHIADDLKMKGLGVKEFRRSVYYLLKIIETTRKAYDELKGSEEWRHRNTHCYITSHAIDFLNGIGKNAKDKLIDACTLPDNEKEMREILFEGHFYGEVSPGEYGNYLKRIPKLYPLLDLITKDNLDENAVSNFTTHYNRFKKNGNLKELGVSAHYIQDVTAPHHAGNMAIGFELISDGMETHYIFEKYAREFLFGAGHNMNTAISNNYKELKAAFDKGTEAFTGKVYALSTPNIASAKETDSDKWEQTILNAIPIAIAATAVIFEQIKK